MAVVLVGAQWGDEGKGKMTDFLAEKADVVVRYQGGSNAGHTVVVAGKTHKLHLIPSGILAGKISVIGNGVVVDPGQMLREIAGLELAGCDPSLVKLSDIAHVIMPYHHRLDSLEEVGRGDRKIGTTQRGIGPAYMDKAARSGIRVVDLLNPALFREKVAYQLTQVNHLLERVYDSEGFDPDQMADEYLEHAEGLAPHVCDTSVLINDALDEGKKVLFEGAQGTMLDVDHGTYPYVTSSHPTAGGACIGTGVGPTKIRKVIGVAKAYTSRVGDGPMPSELHGEMGELLRERGAEYGTTTGRPRRVGWLDTVILRYSVRVSGLAGLCITKLDTLSGLETIKVATAYRHEGERVAEYPHDLGVFGECEPEYVELPGWSEDITGVRSHSDLPAAAQDYLAAIEEMAGAPVYMISVGPGREQTIEVQGVFE